MRCNVLKPKNPPRPNFRFICFTGVRDPWTDDDVTHVVDANTKSEARSLLKKKYGLDRLPVESEVVKFKRFNEAGELVSL